MSTRRNGAAVIDGTVKSTTTRTTTRSITPLSTSRKLPALSSNPLSSSKLEKENNNPRRSTSRGPTSNPPQKPVTRPIARVDRKSSSAFSSLPRGRSPSPSDLSQTRRVSVDRTVRDPTHLKSRRDSTFKPSDKLRSTDKVKDLSTNGARVEENSNNSNNSSKYQSKLHEKLAFLEGKVKRIASDIKKTKEMLDLNNPDASKVILSDIQDKISGIEKAMVRVVVSGDENSNKQVDIVDGVVNDVNGVECLRPIKANSLVIGLNSDELEARLIPHHKLIRDRTLVKANVEIEENVRSSVDENSIALEFLATLEGTIGYPCDGIEREKSGSSNNQKCDIDMLLEADEKLEEFDDQEKENIKNTQEEEGFVGDETDEAFNFKLNGIGNKIAAAGWFVSEGEAVLLAHEDATCSYYDIANSEEKSVYIPPPGVSPSIWRDCWLIRAQGSDGCSGRYVVAASAGNTMESGFCSWDFYTKEVKAFQLESGTSFSRTALRPLPNNIRRNSTTTLLSAEASQWWYKPCGPLVISTCTSQRGMKVYDVRDGEQVMRWEVPKPVVTMEYSSPLQWRNRGKVVVAEAESLSLWDVSSLSPQALVSVPFGGKKISALHVSNTDAELGGGVRKRVSSSEAEGNDGVFCTSDSINILDFRQASGIGLKIPKHGLNIQSIFSRGDSVFLGCTTSNPTGKKQPSSLIQQFSLRKQELFSTYAFPESNVHSHYAAVSQVWGNSDFVMGVCGLGLYVFDATKDDVASRVLNMDYDTNNGENFREVVGPDDLYWPSFDYMGSRSLLISRDRPAMWRHLIV
ncbi:unnamed protein product [Vicia faba]|uniref:At4g14310 8-bladed propeller domain-containing protein n=1 Tax=Vicia faba TaxID=3906 RepID=A0AAV0ZXP2_VICFA|nr:unnamed protein product [Vicia faba]